MAIETLKTRREFLRIRGGLRAATPAFVLEAKRCQPVDDERRARFGFTVTKKLGNAVRRNRIRRRLKAAISETAGGGALSGYDNVVVSRSAAFDMPFCDLKHHFSGAFGRIARLARQTSRPAEPP